MKRPKIISLGEVFLDLFPDKERFGGAPANFECHGALACADVTLVSAERDWLHWIGVFVLFMALVVQPIAQYLLMKFVIAVS